ncbi:MAG: phosphotransferase [Bacteroidota bacterium]
MNLSEVKQLATKGSFGKKPIKASIIETHISWVLMSEDFVFKIKKPVKLNFLNFSSLNLRRHYCMREIFLNQSYSDIYLDVLPIRKENDNWTIGNGNGDIIDYAVRMKRIQNEKKMDVRLDDGKISKIHIEELANTISKIHREAEIVNSNFNLDNLRDLFNGFSDIKPFALKYLDKKYFNIIDRSIAWSNKFLESHKVRMKQRTEEGFIRLLHGDLHCGNVFISNPPVIFDCIEFDDNLRQIDILSEIGFLCMDIEAHDEPNLSDYFVEKYNKLFNVIQTQEDFEILHYYKCFRATIRARVSIINAEQQQNSSKFKEALSKAKTYLRLLKTYLPSKVYIN